MLINPSVSALLKTNCFRVKTHELYMIMPLSRSGCGFVLQGLYSNVYCGYIDMLKIVLSSKAGTRLTKHVTTSTSKTQVSAYFIFTL